MAKEEKKTPKEASSVFHNIMAASVQGNPKPKRNFKKSIEDIHHSTSDKVSPKSTAYTQINTEITSKIVGEINGIYEDVKNEIKEGK